jgi:anthranilate synthase/aminodeoxychorismate synthase-like glutamine amidotransferase
MIFILDNYDSFTYNLVQAVGALGQEIEVFRNDKITVQEIEDKHPTHIIISPGPCTPKEAGISDEVVRHFAGKVPILGVCLGHQSIAHAFGAEIIRASRLMHGKTSLIHHDGKAIYRGLENPFTATRYHSLIVKEDALPDSFIITARSEIDELMGIRHKEYPLEGVQFHPESFLTEQGPQLLKNFIES